jgi:sigma-B regulation protein RsbU (phosphoserine phosphatase)
VIGPDNSPQPVPLRVVPGDVAVQVADLVFAGRYIPAGPGPEPIAGDFYDLFRLDDDLIGVVVGDVAGHGSAASAQMNALRAATRAYAIEQSGPASVIARLDRFGARLDAESISTVWYGEYRPSTGELRYANAGHPPPVLTAHDAPTLLLELTSSPPLGVGAADEFAVEHGLQLPPGAILIAYSDGLIERRDTDLDDQLSMLTAVVTAACDPARAATAAQIASDILDALIPDPTQAEDDVCLLVLRREAPGAASG